MKLRHTSNAIKKENETMKLKLTSNAIKVEVRKIPYHKYKKRRIMKKHYPNGIPTGIKLNVLYHQGVQILELGIPYNADKFIVEQLTQELRNLITLKKENESVVICDGIGHIALDVNGSAVCAATRLTLKIGDMIYVMYYDDRLRDYATIRYFTKEQNTKYPTHVYIQHNLLQRFQDIGTTFAQQMLGEEADMIRVTHVTPTERRIFYAEVDKNNDVLLNCYDYNINCMFGRVRHLKGAVVK